MIFMIKKIILIFAIFMLIGTAVQSIFMTTRFQTISELKMTTASDGDFAISFGKYNESDNAIIFTNDSDKTVLIKDNIANYTINNGVGVIEILDVDGEKVIVDSYVAGSYKG